MGIFNRLFAKDPQAPPVEPAPVISELRSQIEALTLELANARRQTLEAPTNEQLPEVASFILDDLSQPLGAGLRLDPSVSDVPTAREGSDIAGESVGVPSSALTESEVAPLPAPLSTDSSNLTIEALQRSMLLLRLNAAIRHVLTCRLLQELHTFKLDLKKTRDEAMGLRHEILKSADLTSQLRITQSENARLESKAQGLLTQITELRQVSLDRRSLQREARDLNARLADTVEKLHAAEAKLLDQKVLQQRNGELEVENRNLRQGRSPEGWDVELLRSRLQAEVELLKRSIDAAESRARMAEDRASAAGRLLASRPDTARVRQLEAVERHLRETIAELRREAETAKVDRQRHEQRATQEQSRLSDKIALLEERIRQSPDAWAASVWKWISNADQRIVDWLLTEATPAAADVPYGYLSLVGDGPWSRDDMARVMEGLGYSLWALPDQDLAHVVVGRSGWDGDDLAAQMDARGKAGVRIYSQEMWLLKLVTGRDPFDSGDEDLLMALAHGHDALHHLIQFSWPWPVSGKKRKGGVIEIPDMGRSPLHFFGYHVGRTASLSMRERRDVLAKFLDAKKIDFDEDATIRYRQAWGRPGGPTRLLQMARHLKWLIETQGRQDRMSQADQDWRDDMAWLKATYYRNMRKRFPWPGLK